MVYAQCEMSILCSIVYTSTILVLWSECQWVASCFYDDLELDIVCKCYERCPHSGGRQPLFPAPL